MKFKKTFIIICLFVCLFAMASVCASDANDTAMASEDTTLELSANNRDGDILQTNEENPILAVEDNNETVSAETNSEIITADQYNYSYLREQIGSGGNITLTKGTYTYNQDDGNTIKIKDSGVIDGNGAIIDMAGFNKRAFEVTASGVTIKNLTIKNANFNDNGGAILFSSPGTVINCNFTDNSVTYGSGGAVFFDDDGTVTNCIFTNNNADTSGGAVWFSKSGNVTNCNFTNNQASRGNGGAITYSIFGTTFEVRNCNFANNTASRKGGAVFIFNEGNVTNCNFTGNKATDSDSCGGAVYFSHGGTVTNCIFTSNIATSGSGGAVFIFNEGNVTNCNFTNNTANYFGGAVYFNSSGTTFEVRNCNFTDNSVTYGSGGAVFFDDDGTVTNCIFTNNNADTSGGAVWFSKSGNVTNCNFTNNQASRGNGGAIAYSPVGTTNEVRNCNFANNTASRNGGAVFIFNEGNVTNCNFTGNKATDSDSCGGAVYFSYGGTVTNCNFTDNQVSRGNGSAIYYSILGTTHEVRNCNFTGNKATDSDSCGGAVYFSSSGNVTNCNFTNNTANGDGGAIYFSFSGTTHEVRNCNFTDNSVTYGSGGAVFFDDDGTVTNCNFTGNKATDSDSCGGAVYFSYGGTVTNCIFTSNIATSGSGGAVFIFNNEGNVANCNFTNNTANYYGGAILMYSGSVENCNFTNNSASYGGAIVFIDTGSVTNCNFTGNDAATGSAIYFDSYSSIKIVSNSCLLNNRANAESLEVTPNRNNITIIFTGKDNLLNAIYSNGDVTFTNVTYWGANGTANTDSSTPVRSNREAGQNITVGVVVNGELVLSEVKVTDENGMIVLKISAGENYYIDVRHDTDSYYTEAGKTISNNTKFNVNVTSQTTHNKTVNITAKSDIYSEVMPGKLLFILPNTYPIAANYGGNGTWWAVHTFYDYEVYGVNATYIGLDNVTINNATITITKANSTITLDNVVLDYGNSIKVNVTTEGAVAITAMIDSDDVGVIKYTIPISGLNAGIHTLTVTAIPDQDHVAATKTVNITVNKCPTAVEAPSIAATYGINKNLVATLKDTSGNIIKSAKVTVKVGTISKTLTTNSKGQVSVDISSLVPKTYTASIKFAGNANYKDSTKSVKVTVKKANTKLIASGKSFAVKATKKVTATLKDSKNKLIKNRYVTFKVAGKSYKVKTNSKGVATATVKITKKGLFATSVSFAGDAYYNKCSKSIKVTVK